jgi:hypothetical protein
MCFTTTVFSEQPSICSLPLLVVLSRWSCFFSRKHHNNLVIPCCFPLPRICGGPISVLLFEPAKGIGIDGAMLFLTIFACLFSFTWVPAISGSTVLAIFALFV